MTTLKSIDQVADDANELFDQLTEGVDVDIDIPTVDVDTDIDLPEEVGPIYEEIPRVSINDLTQLQLDGQGVFDVLMQGVNLHLEEQHKKNRITGGDYAKVYTAAIESVAAQSIQFLLSKDRAYWESVNAQTTAQLAALQKARVKGEMEVLRLQIHLAQLESVKAELQAHTLKNQLAESKMALVTAYNNILTSENQAKLVAEQMEAARGQTLDTRSDGSPISGMLGTEKELRQTQMLTAREEMDTARAQTKETLQDGTPVQGLVALQKQVEESRMHLTAAQAKVAEEQYETTRAQVRDTLSDGQPIGGMQAIDKATKLANQRLVEEQADAARAQTKDTLYMGGNINGLLALEKVIKTAQGKLVNEQMEAARAQTRPTLSTGEGITGLLGAQTDLYREQITSYKRDAESKFTKMLLDTWVARKTIDEGVAVPSAIDEAAINTVVTSFRNNLEF